MSKEEIEDIQNWLPSQEIADLIFELSCDPPLMNTPEGYICPGCQRNDLHMMCPAYGTPFYMSGVPFPEKLAKIIAVLNPDDRQIIFEVIKGFASVETDKQIRGLQLDRTPLQELGRQMNNNTEWNSDETWCPNCKEFTTQDVKWGGHERDSTNDRAICTVCKWTLNGYTGQYEPPSD